MTKHEIRKHLIAQRIQIYDHPRLVLRGDEVVEVIGLHPGDPVVDNGSLDHLLTEEERREVLCWDGRGWVPVAERRKYEA